MLTKWSKSKIETRNGILDTIAPIIISASRSTDIPAFHSEWFIKRLKEGYLKWINPFNRKSQYISFDKTRVIVFWTKDAKPIITHLPEVAKKNINYYFTYTVNDYEKEKYEPNIPRLEQRIKTFQELSKKIGKEKVIWRFDPLIMTDKLGPDELIRKIEKVGNELFFFTEKLVISFADISGYSKVRNNLTKKRIRFKEFDENNMKYIASALRELSKKWDISIASCSEKCDLSFYNIKHNKCVDDELMIRLFRNDHILMDFLGYESSLFDGCNNKMGEKLKDKGQRKECGCIMSKDIGQYNTCKHLCVYCYANLSEKLVKDNFCKKTKNSQSESIIGD